MITEDRVTFEIAKLLRDKGFPQNTLEIDCNVCYKYNGKLCNNAKSMSGVDREISYMAPTIQMVLKWLREVHDIAIETKWEHLCYAYIKPMTSKPSEEDYYQCESSKYEKACEAAIKYVLENLI